MGEINGKKYNVEEFTEIGKELIKVARCEPSTIDEFPNENIAEYDDTNDGKKFTCKTCRNQFNQLGNIRTHEKSVHWGKKFTCKTCDNHFTQKGYLRKHEESVHGGKKFACKTCDNQFSHKGDVM